MLPGSVVDIYLQVTTMSLLLYINLFVRIDDFIQLHATIIYDGGSSYINLSFLVHNNPLFSSYFHYYIIWNSATFQ
jgi:hypothetical protein